MKPNKLYRLLWKKFGRRHQIDVLIEEQVELIKSLLKARRSKKKHTSAIIEELADVEICVGQLKWYLKKKGVYQKVNKIKKYKLKRTKKLYLKH